MYNRWTVSINIRLNDINIIENINNENKNSKLFP